MGLIFLNEIKQISVTEWELLRIKLSFPVLYIPSLEAD
jgi:hypothetical protein